MFDIPDKVGMHLGHHEITVMFLALGVLLATARTLGEIAQWCRQPAVLGELLAGVILGPTVLGFFAPDFQKALFPTTGVNALALQSIATLSIVMFLLVAGMEVDLSTVWRQGRTALRVGLLGTVIPFLIGLGAAGIAPHALGMNPESNPWIFALFVATAMAISALPVIAKTLMDLNLYRSDFGMVVISAAIMDDLIGWTVFAVILGLMHQDAGQASNVAMTIGLTLLYAGGMLTLGRAIIHRVLPYLQAYTHWPGGTLSFALALALLGAAYTEWIGIHAIFGSFLVGVALGDSPRLSERTRVTIDQFVSFIFAPVFFGSIGLRLNFYTHFDLPLVIVICLLACVCKLSGATLGAAWGGMPKREAWAVGFALNARGAMEIILGVLALEAGVISQRLFVAIVVMAIATSMLGGPAIQWLLKPRKGRRLSAHITPRTFLRRITAHNRRESIHELTEIAAAAASVSIDVMEAAVWKREKTLPTGIGFGVAIPHARLPELKEPLIAVGISEVGIDFDAPDALPAHVIFLVVTPEQDGSSQLELTAEIARLFSDPSTLERVLRSSNYTEFLAVLRSTEIDRPHNNSGPLGPMQNGQGSAVALKSPIVDVH